MSCEPNDLNAEKATVTLPSPLIKNCRNKTVKMYFEKIAATFWSHQPHKDIALSSLVDILLFEMTNSNADSDDRDSGVAGEIVRAISAAPYRRYSLDEMAQMFSVSGRTIEDIMKRTVGMSFSKYQNAVKLEMAAQQIAAEPNIRLAEIAATLGFCDEFHLSKAFKARYGVSPSKYRDGAM